MPLEIRHSEDGRITYVKATGPANYNDWVALRDQEQEAGQRRLLLADVRPRDDLPSGPDAREEGYLAGAWDAVAIVTREGAQYGMARVVAAIAEGQGTRVQVFTEPGPAEQWLRDFA